MDLQLNEQEEVVALNWRIEINLYDSQMSILDTEVYWITDPSEIRAKIGKIVAKWPSVCWILVSMKKDETP